MCIDEFYFVTIYFCSTSNDEVVSPVIAFSVPPDQIKSKLDPPLKLNFETFDGLEVIRYTSVSTCCLLYLTTLRMLKNFGNSLR